MAARSAKALSTFSQTWSNGDNFDGYMLVGCVVPNGKPRCELGQYSGVVDVPIFTLFPITNGAFDQSTELLYTTDLTPPGAQYVAWLCDKSFQQIGSVSSGFTVSSTPWTPPTITATVPSTGTSPTPNFNT